MVAGTGIALYTGVMYWLALGPAFVVGWLGLRSLRGLYFLLLLTIPLSAEVQLTDRLGTDLPDEALMWLLTILTGLSAVAYRRRIAEKKADRVLLYLLLAHFGWIVITACLSPDPLLSFKYVAAKAWYLVAFVGGTWWLLRSAADLRRAAWLLILPMTLACIYILWAHGQSGYSFDSVNAAVQPFFRNHVNYAALLVCLFPLAVVLFILQPRYRFIILLVLMAWIPALVFSYSRGAWVAAGVGVITVMAIRWRALTAAAFLSVAGVVFLLVFFLRDNRYLDYRPDFERTIYHQAFREHLQATYRLTDLSTAERFHRWIAGTRMVGEAPFFGHGPNRFYPVYRPYTVNAFRTYVSDNPERSTVHNYFLLLAVEQGFPGLLLFLLVLARMFWLVSRYYHDAYTKTARATWLAVGAVLGMILLLNMLSDLVETDKIGGVFFICAGLILGGKDLFTRDVAYSTGSAGGGPGPR
jgi:O-antigen ligase